MLRETDNTYNYTYKKLDNVDYNNYLSVALQWYYDTYEYKLTFSEEIIAGMVMLIMALILAYLNRRRF